MKSICPIAIVLLWCILDHGVHGTDEWCASGMKSKVQMCAQNLLPWISINTQHEHYVCCGYYTGNECIKTITDYEGWCTAEEFAKYKTQKETDYTTHKSECTDYKQCVNGSAHITLAVPLVVLSWAFIKMFSKQF